MSQKKSKSWPELGLITKNTFKGADGKETTVMGFKLNEEVANVLRAAGFEISGFGNLVTPVEEVERLFKNGAIGEDKIEQRRTQAEAAHAWLRYKVILPPPKN